MNSVGKLQSYLSQLRRNFRNDYQSLTYRARLRRPGADRRFDIQLRTLQRVHGVFRIEASLHGHGLWISSASELVAAPEIVPCAFLFHAMMARQPIVMNAPLDKQFAEHLDRIQDMAVGWWPQMSRVTVNAGETEAVRRTSRAAAFFTAGVDSFCTLRRNEDRIDGLINIEGFDIRLWDTDRLGRNRELMARVGKAVGKRIVSVSTNIRNYIPFRRQEWEITHLAKIAAIAHALSAQFSTVYVASSDVPPPWGSHRDLDPLWSSSALAVVNDGAELSRLEKVRTIFDWDIVDEAIKVCWENRAATLNCGVCEKCVRTQLQFIAAGARDVPRAFPKVDLRERVDSIPRVMGALKRQWKDIEANIDVASLKPSITALVGRS